MPKDIPALDHTPRTAQGHSTASLDTAGMATFLRYPRSEEAKQLVATVTTLTLEHEAQSAPRERVRSRAAQRSFEQAVGAFLADLIAHQRNTDADGFMYRLSDKEMLSETLVSAQYFDQLRSFWCEMRLIEQTQYFRAQQTWEGDPIDLYIGRARRFRATSELMELVFRV
jgi:hypothetical protein